MCFRKLDAFIQLMNASILKKEFFIVQTLIKSKKKPKQKGIMSIIAVCRLLQITNTRNLL